MAVYPMTNAGSFRAGPPNPAVLRLIFFTVWRLTDGWGSVKAFGTGVFYWLFRVTVSPVNAEGIY